MRPASGRRERVPADTPDDASQGRAVCGEGIGLVADPVQRRHQQLPQPLTERIGSRQFGEPPDGSTGRTRWQTPAKGLSFAEQGHARARVVVTVS